MKLNGLPAFAPPTSGPLAARIAIGCLLAAIVAAPVAAQPTDYARKPVQVLVALQAGSASDVAVWVLAAKLAASLGQHFVVVNVPGVGGVLGASRVAKSSPDGYLLGAFNNGVFTILPHICPRAGSWSPITGARARTGIARGWPHCSTGARTSRRSTRRGMQRGSR